MEKARVNGITIAYEMAGQGEPLLLIHGAGVSRLEWKPQLEALGEYFRLVMPDVRGHGDSEQTKTPYTMKLFADDMIALLDALKLEQVLILGHSMGGTIAQQMAVDHPERVKGLVLAETSYGTANEPLLRWAGVAAEWMMRLVGVKRLIPMSAKQFARGSKETESMLLEAFEPQVKTPANFINIAHANNLFDGKGVLHRIQCPTLVLIAEHNRVTHKFGHYMAEAIPDARLQTIPNAGHTLNWDNAAAFNRVVVNFLKEKV